MSKIYNEYLKLKYSKLKYFVYIGVALAPVSLLLLVVIINSDNSHNNVTYLEYMSLILKFIISVLSLTLYNWLAGELVAVEFRLDTFKSQVTIPVSRGSFLFTKLSFISILVVMMTLTSFILGVVIALVLNFSGFSFEITLKLLPVYLKSSFLVLPFTYFTVMLIVWFRTSLAPMIVNLMIFALTIVVRNFNLYAIFPWSAPYRIIFISSDYGNFTLGNSYFAIFILGIISMYLANNRINKMEI